MKLHFLKYKKTWFVETKNENKLKIYILNNVKNVLKKNFFFNFFSKKKKGVFFQNELFKKKHFVQK